MRIPVGIEYSASAVDLVELRHECSMCGAEAKASVLTTAHGSGAAPLFLFPSEAKRRAAESAVDAIPETARILAYLAECPSCGRRDRETVSARRFSHALRWCARALPIALIVLVLEALVVGVALAISAPVSVLVGVALACWAIAVVIATGAEIRKDRRIADRSVEWTHVRARGAAKWKRLKPR